MSETGNNYDNTGTQRIKELMPRVLVVDDDPVIRSLIIDILAPHAFTVDTAEGSGDALESLIDFKYDLIFLDVNLPGISGHELLKYCKKNLTSTEIIMITGNPGIDIAVNLVKDGAFDFIEKPFTIDTIVGKAKAALESQRRKLRVDREQLVSLGGRSSIGDGESILPDYKVLGTLGSGNMGIVLLVEKEKRKYAMKILRRDGDDETYQARVKRFLREAKILSKIDCPQVVKIYNYGYTSGKEVPFYLMEYIEGKGLIQYIKERSLPLSRKLEIISQVATALEAVHQHGILHRDIKPSNVLIEKDMNAKLTDFGVARISDSSLTMHDEVLGSPAYMSPECFDPRKGLDHRSDIFSLGVLGYELITGEKPFRSDTVSEMMLSIQKSRPIDPCRLVPDLPAGVQMVLANMLNKNQKSRFQSAAEVAEAVKALSRSGDPDSDNIVSRVIKSFAGKVWE